MKPAKTMNNMKVNPNEFTLNKFTSTTSGHLNIATSGCSLTMNNHTHVSSNIGNGTENEVATITLNKSNCLSESGHNTITTFGCSKNKSISPNITKGGWMIWNGIQCRALHY